MTLPDFFLKLFEVEVYPSDSDIPHIHNILTGKTRLAAGRCPDTSEIKCSVNTEHPEGRKLCIACPHGGSS